MRIVTNLMFFFFLFPVWVSAQLMEERTPFSELNYSENFQYQSDFIYHEMYSFYDNSLSMPSGDFLTNIFKNNPSLDLTTTDDDDPRSGDPIAGIPLGSGILFLSVIAMLYLSILFSKKQKIQMKKISLLIVLLVLCSVNSYAQLPFQARPDNFFVRPDTSDVFLNVLHNDELGVCNIDGITITLTAGYPKHGTANKFTTPTVGDSIKYTPNPNFVGQDTLKYTITCSGTVSNETIVLINVSSHPEPIVIGACAIKTQSIDFAIKQLAASSDLGVISVSTPICGDIDGDGITEIIVFTHPTPTANSSTSMYNGLRFYNLVKSLVTGNDTLVIKYTITFPRNYERFPYGNVAIANVDGGNTSAVFVTDDDGVLTKYILSAPGGSFSVQKTIHYSNGNPYYAAAIPIVADMMGDGHVQVIVYDKIYNAADLTLLVDAGFIPANGTSTQYHFGQGSHPINGNPYYPSSLFAVDIDNDGIRELVGGACVYDVHLENYTGTDANNTYTLRLDMRDSIGNVGLATLKDGATAVADIDMDGFMDVVVASPYSSTLGSLYAYNPRTGIRLTSNIINDIPLNDITQPRIFGPSLPFIGDLDGDGYLEIALTGMYTLRAYKYNNTTTPATLDLMWSLPTSDDSGSMTLSLFDFTQSGISQLVYRDEGSLRILDGRKYDEYGILITNASRTLAEINNLYSSTVREYPIIADVNNDGAAEIIVTANPNGLYWNGKVYVFGASSSDKWAPARTVWNQYLYNPVYINDDLTIPAHPLNPATGFIDRNGDINRPFNNFIQQSTLLNDEGRMFRLGPDLTFDETFGTNGATFTTTGISDYQVEIWVTNEGDASFLSPLTVSAYGFTGADFVKLSVTPTPITITDGSIDVGETEQFTFTITGAVASFMPANIQLRLNESDNVLPVTMEECRYWNNYYNRNLWGAPEQVLCEGDSSVYFYPLDSPLDYAWWTDLTSTDLADFLEINKGELSNSALFVKDGTAVQSLYVDVYDGTIKKTTDRIEVKVYLYADSLIWTGLGGTQDWNNAANWLNPDPSSPTAFFPQSWIPRPCTHVLIPDGLDIYPDLSLTATNRMVYNDAACDHIHFEFGGEVARTDSLHYTKAWIQYNFGYYDAGGTSIVDHGFENILIPTTPSVGMERDRWYALSAPLKKIVTGDFSLGGKPHTWQKRFIAMSDGLGGTTGEWVLPENTNDIELNDDLNYAIALYVAKNNAEIGESSPVYQAGLDSLKGIFTIPYFEGPYNESDYDDNGVAHPHRIHKYVGGTSYFKYYWYYVPNVPLAEESYKTLGQITRGDEAYRFIFDENIVQVPSGAATGKNAFKMRVPTNKDVMIGNPFMSTMDFGEFYNANSDKIEDYYRLFDGENAAFLDQIPDNLPDSIAVLQAFFVTVKAAAADSVDLYFPFETVSVTRATGSEHQDYFKSPKNEEGIIRITASNNQGQKNTIALLTNSEEKQSNIHKLFYYEVGTTPQVYFTDKSGQKNAVQYLNEQSQTGLPLGLSVKQGNRITLSFEIDTQIEALTLLDKQTGTKQNLLENNSYTFTQSDNSVYSDRFELTIQSPNAINIIDNESDITIYQTDQTLTVSAKELIQSVELLDIQGRKIQESSKINNTFYQMDLMIPSGVYIVKAKLIMDETKTQKVIVK